MIAPDRFLRIALVLALVTVTAFIVSFFAGLRGGGSGPAAAAGASYPGRENRTRVEVLNAAGRSGLARLATTRLRDHGFDVVFFGNARSFGLDSSVVLDRVGAIGPAREVARALGIGAARTEPDSTLFLDVTVMLGEDWPPPETETEIGVADRFRRWWRRRADAR